MCRTVFVDIANSVFRNCERIFLMTFTHLPSSQKGMRSITTYKITYIKFKINCALNLSLGMFFSLFFP